MTCYFKRFCVVTEEISSQLSIGISTEGKCSSKSEKVDLERRTDGYLARKVVTCTCNTASLPLNQNQVKFIVLCYEYCYYIYNSYNNTYFIIMFIIIIVITII